MSTFNTTILLTEAIATGVFVAGYLFSRRKMYDEAIALNRLAMIIFITCFAAILFRAAQS